MNHSHRHPLHERHVKRHHDQSSEPLHVVAVISNPARYVSRYELFKEFERHMAINPLVRFHPVEMAFGDRPHEVTETGNDGHLQLRTDAELWHKENMINLGVSRLPDDWKYVAWIDADIEFQRKDWAEETIQQLQHYAVVQMFQTAADLGPYGEIMATHNGFAWAHISGRPRPLEAMNGYYYPHWHPGYAWAMRRDAWDSLGGLYDVSMLGSGDHLMAWALLGENRLPSTVSDGYWESLEGWRDRAVRCIHRNIGYVPGSIAHFFHGRKRDRRYKDRWKILEKWAFDPRSDIKRDWQGLYRLDGHETERIMGLRDDIRGYFRARNEDSIDL